DDMSVKVPNLDSQIVQINIVASSPSNETPLASHSDSIQPDPPSILEGMKELTTKEALSEGSTDHLFEDDLSKERGQCLDIRASRSRTFFHSSTPTVPMESRVDSGEEVCEIPSPSQNHIPPVQPSYPKWDGTHGSLKVQMDVEGPNDLSEDDQPLSWKVRKIVSRGMHAQSGDQVRSPSTRGSAKKAL
ncbi:hypothetical protein HAX54_043009, partial [Datura stramonium]|nr:hypothetical protein [Datura stramonium]